MLCVESKICCSYSFYTEHPDIYTQLPGDAIVIIRDVLAIDLHLDAVDTAVAHFSAVFGLIAFIASSHGPKRALCLVARHCLKAVGRRHILATGAELVILGALALDQVIDVHKRTVRSPKLVEFEVILLLNLHPLVVALRHLHKVLATLRVQRVLHLPLALVQLPDSFQVRLLVRRGETAALFTHLLQSGRDAVTLAE